MTSSLENDNSTVNGKLDASTSSHHSKIRSERKPSITTLTDVNKAKYMPPWTTPYIIGVGGTSGSGKTSVAAKIVSEIDVPWTVLVSMDNFYKPLNEEERKLAFDNNYDFDEPAAFDMDLAYESLKSLKEGKKTVIPKYSFVHHNRLPNENITVYAASVIVFEGIFSLYDKRMLDLMDLKIYVDADLDVCLARRLSRDIVSRGRDLEGCITSWERFVKPNAVKYVKRTMENADAIIPSMADNSVAVNLMISHIKTKLQLKSKAHLQKLIALGISDNRDISKLDNVHMLEVTNQTKSIKTMLLDKNLDRDAFVFYFDRIASLLLSKALDNVSTITLPSITTSYGHIMKDVVSCEFDKIAAVNIIRSGDCFMHSLKKTIPNIRVGKLLIQSDSRTGEPQLHFESLPENIDQYKKVYFTETQIISGAALIMAIQVLLDHNVKLENITVVVYMATELGIKRILSAFDNKIDIVIGELIKTEQLHKENMSWSINKFIDAKYFGCK